MKFNMFVCLVLYELMKDEHEHIKIINNYWYYMNKNKILMLVYLFYFGQLFSLGKD